MTTMQSRPAAGMFLLSVIFVTAGGSCIVLTPGEAAGGAGGETPGMDSSASNTTSSGPAGGAGGIGGGAPVCGNGITEIGEECDDANLAVSDGCVGCIACVGPGDFWDSKTWHCYRHVTTGDKTWADARQACIDLGGDLAAISSDPERLLLDQKLSTAAWIGGTDADTECVFTWTNGEPWTPMWNQGEPNGDGDCLVLYGYGTLGDQPCGKTVDYICERVPSGSCGDGIVQTSEECDDGNTTSNDGCYQCLVECNADEFKDPKNLHCYRLVDTSKTWNNAQSACVSAGGVLAAITTPDEVTFIKGHLQGTTWIGGLYEPEPMFPSTWSWASGEPSCWQNWATNQPDGTGTCVESDANGQWSSADCSLFHPYLCERAPLLQ